MKRSYLLLVLVLAACGSGGSGPKALDAGDAADVVTDAPPLPMVDDALCRAAVDLDAAGTLAGDTLTYHGNTDRAPEQVRTVPCQPQAAWPLLLRYRVRGDHVRLRLSTANAGGTPYYDTVLWVLDACRATATVLGCNDDDFLADNDGHLERSGTSTLALGAPPAGTELVIGVAGFAAPRRTARGHGDFVLTVTESPAVLPGGTCDPTVVAPCTRGHDCAASGDLTGVCAVPGAAREPDDTPAQATPIDLTTNATVTAALERRGDVDCFGFSVAGGANLFLQATDGAGGCPWDLRGDLYRVGEDVPIDGDDDNGFDSMCPRLSPAANPGVRAMPAGSYAFCVRANDAALTVPAYVVHLGPSS